jgi:hypothetical protein
VLPTLVAVAATPTMNTTVGNYIDICCTCSTGTWTCQEAIVMKV